MSVGEIASEVGLAHSAASQHLSRLRELDLVSARRDSQTVYYMVSSPHVELVLSILSSIYPGADRCHAAFLANGSTGKAN